MKKIWKLWLKNRERVAIAMLGVSAFWFLSALNCAEENPDVPQLIFSGSFGLFWISRGMKWSF